LPAPRTPNKKKLPPGGWSRRGDALGCGHAPGGAERGCGAACRETEAIFRAGRQGGFQKAIYVGPDDVARGAVRIKNLDDRTEEEKPLTSLLG